jgi:hypothetical protein
MSDEDLELLITLDDPEGAPEEDVTSQGNSWKHLSRVIRDPGDLSDCISTSPST